MGERSPGQILRAALKRIEDPERWTREVFARNADGTPTQSCRDEAACWCARGALYAEVVFPSDADAAEDRLRRAVVERYSVETDDEELIAAFNDDPDTTHADVLAAFDRAIELAETER